PEDLKKYLSVLGDLTYSKSIYRTSFRVLVDNHYQWFQEKGKRLFEDQTGSFIMGTLNPLKTKHFKASNIDELDSLKDQNDLLVKTKQLFQENRYFQLCVVNLKSIPKINERHGREIGNLMMAEYIKNLRKTFVTENGDVYRISGLEFVVLITDARKMDVLASGIKSNKEFLNLAVNYGSIQDEIQAYMGIAVGGSDAHDEYQLYQAAVQALKIAENPQFERNGCYYRDIV
ncbi:MAG: GGDEF domain-containing protein, partial [Acholeplasmataceae bacterium]